MVGPVPAIHHTAIVVSDLEQSLRFYRDGIGLEVLVDRKVEGDWPGLFDAKTRSLRAAFLGEAGVPDVTSGVLELNVFDGEVPEGPAASGPRTGMFMISYFVDVEAVLGRLAELGLGGEPRRIEQQTPNGAITIATVLDPDGVMVLLTPGSITQRAPR
jgi:catechol 2,3-dioxygenase-like lactoylglutathione lyase family enzyme